MNFLKRNFQRQTNLKKTILEQLSMYFDKGFVSKLNDFS